MDFSELSIVPVRREEEAKFLSLMRRHHYLGEPCKIGDSAFYAAGFIVLVNLANFRRRVVETVIVVPQGAPPDESLFER
ncbi:MAG: hypothetical protein OXI60_10735 [Acidiferrobacterales bacterium]|nr:hypothetical protein [Acidiferrobacterales bacterium]